MMVVVALEGKRRECRRELSSDLCRHPSCLQERVFQGPLAAVARQSFSKVGERGIRAAETNGRSFESPSATVRGSREIANGQYAI
jgi:hypothetical protein